MRRRWFLFSLVLISFWITCTSLNALEFDGWISLDSGATPAAPALVYDAADNLHLFVRGTDDGVYHRTRNSAGVWGAWEALGGLTPSAPSATFDVLTGNLHAFVRGTDNGIYQNTRNPNGIWSGWAPVGGLTTDGTGAATDSTGNTTLAVKDVGGTRIWINEGGPGGSGVCITKMGQATTFGDTATFTIANPCTGNTLTITIQPSSTGFFACGPRLVFVQGSQQFGDSTFTWRDTATNASVCDDLLPGVTKTTRVTVNAGVPLNFNAPFSVFYDGTKVVDFP
jgi:hypothetical protein